MSSSMQALPDNFQFFLFCGFFRAKAPLPNPHRRRDQGGCFMYVSHQGNWTDGLPAIFYEKSWSVIGPNVTTLIHHIFGSGSFPDMLNHTHLTLIPKKYPCEYPFDYCPFGLCNVLCKIAAKIIANTLRPLLPNVISNNQSAFVNGRQITDNFAIASRTHPLDEGEEAAATLLCPQVGHGEGVQ